MTRTGIVVLSAASLIVASSRGADHPTSEHPKSEHPTSEHPTGDHAVPAHQGSPELEKMKGLVGSWSGTMDMGQGEMPFNVVYKVTAGGSAVVAVHNPESPMEMVSVYHDEGGTLAMTRYCMLGNQPYMAQTGSTDDSVTLSLKGGRGLSNAEEQHMHGVTIRFIDENTIEENWVNFDGGKKTAENPILLKRTGG